MPETIGERPDFADRLKDEVQRILSDPALERAPTQRRLLSFLVEQTLSNPGNLTQFSIAVDGLGRPEDYDLTSDSYPRVQMSRLRRNLLSYYSRNAPGEGHCIHIRPGEYRLRLAPPEAAYPELFKQGRAHFSADERASAGETGDARPRKRWAGLANIQMAALLAAVAIFLSILALAISEFQRRALVKPAVGLDISVSEGFTKQTGWHGFAPDIMREAENYVSKSFVASYSKDAANGPAPDYVISMNFGLNLSDAPDLKLTMRKGNGQMIYSSTIRANPKAKEFFIDEVNANLSYLLSPTGALAHDRIVDQQFSPETDYRCFLKIEIGRSEGTSIRDLVDKCLDRFEDSEYRPHWYARKALSQYARGLRQGVPIDKNAPAWNSLQEAMQLDRYNPFANYLAAKVEASRGNCERADIFADRALQRSTSYPALLGATLTEAVACGGGGRTQTEWATQIHSLARANPDPDPLLKLHLMLATLAIGDAGTSKRIADSLPIEDPKGNMAIISASISRALYDQQYFQQNRQRIDRQIALLIWNEAGRKLILDELSKAPTAQVALYPMLSAGMEMSTSSPARSQR